MPIYEYQCRTCSQRFEELVRGEDKPVCPSCSGRKLERLVSAFAVGSANAGGAVAAEPQCGACGMAPGSCMMQ